MSNRKGCAESSEDQLGMSQSSNSADTSVVSSPFAAPSVQGRLTRSKNCKQRALPQRQEKSGRPSLMPSPLPGTSAPIHIPSANDKVLQWMGLSHRQVASSVQIHQDHKKSKDDKVALESRGSDASSVTEACAPPSTCGSHSEIMMFSLDLEAQ